MENLEHYCLTTLNSHVLQPTNEESVIKIWRIISQGDVDRTPVEKCEILPNPEKWWGALSKLGIHVGCVFR